MEFNASWQMIGFGKSLEIYRSYYKSKLKKYDSDIKCFRSLIMLIVNSRLY